MILFGLLMERQQKPGEADWSVFWFGSLVVCGAMDRDPGPTPSADPLRPPGFVYAITVVELILFSFAVNMVLQYRQTGRWHDYLTGEISDVVLSITAKSLLAWLIFANVLRT